MFLFEFSYFNLLYFLNFSQLFSRFLLTEKYHATLIQIVEFILLLYSNFKFRPALMPRISTKHVCVMISLIAIALCLIGKITITNLTISGNYTAQLSSIQVSNQGIVGIGPDGKIYDSDPSQNNITLLKQNTFLNNNTNHLGSHIHIQNKGINGTPVTLIYNDDNLTIYDNTQQISTFLKSMDGFYIRGAAIGENANQCFVYQIRCQFISDQSGFSTEDLTIKIQKYQNSTLTGETTLNIDDCTYYELYKMYYSSNRVFVQFRQQLMVFNTSSWSQLFSYNSTATYDFKHMDVSVSSNYLVFSYGPQLFVVSLSDFSQICQENQTQIITGIRIVEPYAILATSFKERINAKRHREVL